MRMLRCVLSAVCASFALCVTGCITIGVKNGANAKALWPPIINVQTWGGTPIDATRISAAKKHRITHITLHHGGVAFLSDRDPIQYLRNLQTWSRNTRMWLDIPYHYLIDLDGNVYEGRDINFAGDTNTEYDPTGHALIVVLGNFDEVNPNPAQLGAVTAMMAALAAAYRVPVENIAGHKDYSAQTACPGKNLYPYLVNGYFRREVVERLMAAQLGRNSNR
jgi:N-acetylmuramoyl-L-alanine amidase